VRQAGQTSSAWIFGLLKRLARKALMPLPRSRVYAWHDTMKIPRS